MSRILALVALGIGCSLVGANGEDFGGDFSISFDSSSYIYNGSNGCSLGFCDSDFTVNDGSAWSGDSSWMPGFSPSELELLGPSFKDQMDSIQTSFQDALQSFFSRDAFDPNSPDSLGTYDKIKTVIDVAKDIILKKGSLEIAGDAVGLGILDLMRVFDPPLLNDNELPPDWAGVPCPTCPPYHEPMPDSGGPLRIVPPGGSILPPYHEPIPDSGGPLRIVPPGNYNGLDSNGNYVHVNPQNAAVTDNSLQNLLLMQQIMASLGPRTLQPIPVAPPAPIQPVSPASKPPITSNVNSASQATTSAAPQGSSGSGYCANPAANINNPHGVTPVSGPGLPPGAVTSPNAPGSSYTPLFIPCSQVPTTSPPNKPATAGAQTASANSGQRPQSVVSSQSVATRQAAPSNPAVGSLALDRLQQAPPLNSRLRNSRDQMMEQPTGSPITARQTSRGPFAKPQPTTIVALQRPSLPQPVPGNGPSALDRLQQPPSLNDRMIASRGQLIEQPTSLGKNVSKVLRQTATLRDYSTSQNGQRQIANVTQGRTSRPGGNMRQNLPNPSSGLRATNARPVTGNTSGPKCCASSAPPKQRSTPGQVTASRPVSAPRPATVAPRPVTVPRPVTIPRPPVFVRR